MSMLVYMELTANGTPIDGDGEVKTVGGDDVSKKIQVIDCDLEARVKMNDRTGQPEAERRYLPIKVRKYVDQTSPEIAQAISQYLPIKAIFTFYKTLTTLGETGGQEVGTVPYYKVTVDGGRIVRSRIGQATPYGVEDTSGQDGGYVEDLEISFTDIDHEHVVAGKQHSDRWADRK